jgi:hypothetical protein
MKKGTVFFHNHFEFKDGDYGEKLIIVLNNMQGDDPFLCCKTTSKIKYSLENEGCYFQKNIHVIDKPPFNEKTWVQFDPNSVFEFAPAKLVSDSFQNYIKIIGCLEDCHINAIVNCFKKSEDISEYHISLLDK